MKTDALQTLSPVQFRGIIRVPDRGNVTYAKEFTATMRKLDGGKPVFYIQATPPAGTAKGKAFYILDYTHAYEFMAHVCAGLKSMLGEIPPMGELGELVSLIKDEPTSWISRMAYLEQRLSELSSNDLLKSLLTPLIDQFIATHQNEINEPPPETGISIVGSAVEGNGDDDHGGSSPANSDLTARLARQTYYVKNPKPLHLLD